MTCTLLIDAVYDITIAYKHRLPTFLDNVYGIDPSEVHIHINGIQVSDIPTSEDEVAAWLIERFRLKDELLSNYSKLGHFPNEGTEGELSTLKCLANFTAVVSATGILTYLTLFSSVWFKVFVAFSCVLLTVTTCYSIHLPQLIGSPEVSTRAKVA
jgi:lysocardiolipin and lysophospholipid acyltransferase